MKKMAGSSIFDKSFNFKKLVAVVIIVLFNSELDEDNQIHK
jgi:hypothetical protein